MEISRKKLINEKITRELPRNLTKTRTVSLGYQLLGILWFIVRLNLKVTFPRTNNRRKICNKLAKESWIFKRRLKSREIQVCRNDKDKRFVKLEIALNFVELTAERSRRNWKEKSEKKKKGPACVHKLRIMDHVYG